MERASEKYFARLLDFGALVKYTRNMNDMTLDELIGMDPREAYRYSEGAGDEPAAGVR